MPRKAISASVRWAVFARDGFRCRYCGCQAGHGGVVLVVDHALSIADGGDNSDENLVSSCERCNIGKGAKSVVAGDENREFLTEAIQDALHDIVRGAPVDALAASLTHSCEWALGKHQRSEEAEA